MRGGDRHLVAHAVAHEAERGGELAGGGRREPVGATGREAAGLARDRVPLCGGERDRAVLDLHDWGDLGTRLNGMIRENRWSELWTEISDEMLDQIAVVAPPDELPHRVRERYTGLLDRVGYYFPFIPQEADKQYLWEQAARVFQ